MFSDLDLFILLKEITIYKIYLFTRIWIVFWLLIGIFALFRNLNMVKRGLIFVLGTILILVSYNSYIEIKDGIALREEQVFLNPAKFKEIHDKISYNQELASLFKSCVMKRQRETSTIFYCVLKNGETKKPLNIDLSLEDKLYDVQIKRVFSYPVKLDPKEIRTEPLNENELRQLNYYKNKVLN